MLAALAHGKHGGSECPIGTTLKDLWALVDASEKARRHCMHIENCNYGYNEMLVNRMVHEGVFGEVLHAEAAYLHDLREILFENRDEGLWRRAWHTRSNSNLYPTHGLGPVSWYLDIHAGDRFDYLVSVSTPERGLSLPPRGNGDGQVRSEVARALHHRRSQHVDSQDGQRQDRHVAARRLQRPSVHAPQSRHGHEGDVRGLSAAHLRRRSGRRRAWKPIESWKTKFEHPLWTKLGEQARRADTAGWTSSWRIVSSSACAQGLPPDYDVYDAATWSAPLPLTEMSVAKGSAPMKFPDFTRGNWKTPRQRDGRSTRFRRLDDRLSLRDDRLGHHRRQHRISFLPALFFWRRASSSTTEFFTSGRAAPWWLVGISMVATTFSTDTPNLVTNLVRERGVSENWLWWSFLLTGMMTVFFYARLWRRSGVLTDLEFYEIRYSGKAATRRCADSARSISGCSSTA